MPMRQNREPQKGRSARTRRASLRRRRRGLTRLGALLLLLALALTASLAPTGQASADGESPPTEEQAVTVTSTTTTTATAPAASTEQAEPAVTRRTQRESEAAARKAQRQSEAAARKAQREAQRAAGKRAGPHLKEGPGGAKNEAVRPNAKVHTGCTRVLWTFKDFPNAHGNTVSEALTIRSEKPAKRIAAGIFKFDGPEATQAMAIHAPPGRYLIDMWAHWKTNGLKGGFDIHLKLECEAEPAFSIEKLQRIEGGGGEFTTSNLTGQVGQTVEYEIVLKNTGNVPLTFDALSDAQCDGAISGGLGATALAAGESATYTCSRVITTADRSAGSISNTASTTGTPRQGEGEPITHGSNTVIVNVPPAASTFSIEKLQKISGVGSFTTSVVTGKVGQTVDYEIRMQNTGNVALTLGGFTDSQCDAGTIAGGPIGGMLAAGATTSYSCSHLLTAADQSAGSYSNAVTLTGTPPEGEGAPVTHTSNTVVVEVPATPPGPGTPETPPGQTPGGGGVLSSTVNQSQSGVLGFSSDSVPALRAPQGCVRTNFRASIKSAGVHKVTFYLDGHKLKTLTSKNAHKGLLTIQINPTKWKLGAHRLLAKITMAHPAPGKAATASRMVRVLRCRAALLTPKFTG